eukprot:1155968-Pelagomonas_calceolata.AAC.5
MYAKTTWLHCSGQLHTVLIYRKSGLTCHGVCIRGKAIELSEYGPLSTCSTACTEKQGWVQLGFQSCQTRTYLLST